MAPQTFGKYVVTQRLSRGSMAEVYDARDPGLGRRVAIKVIHPYLAAAPGFNERFQREAELIARLRHPHIVQFYDFDLAGEQPFLVMEYLKGGSLADLLAKYAAQAKTLPAAEIAHILDPLTGALDYAHDRGAIHGDIRPANILFTEHNAPVLTDFGIARIIAECARLGSSATITGSPAYMSPEQAADKPLDARSDIYSLGVVLYEMATGRLPFTGSSPMAVMMQHLNDPPPPPRQFAPDLPEAAQEVVLRALAKEPGARYSDAGSMTREWTRATQAEKSPIAEMAEDDPMRPVTPPPARGDATPAARPTELPQEEQPLPDEARPGAPRGESPRSAQPEPENAVPHWLAHLAGAAEVTGALIGRQAPAMRAAPHDRRGLLATIFGAVGILLATLQFVVQFFDLVERRIQPLIAILPYLIVVLLCGGAALSLYMLLRSHSPAVKKRAAATLGLVVVIGLVWGGWTAYERLRPVKGFLIAVGEFDGPKASRQIDFARRIYDQIKGEVGNTRGEVSVQRTLEVYPNQEAARARGAERKASLVIWGWYDDAGVSPHVEMLHLPSFSEESVGIPLLARTANAASQAAPRQGSLRDVARFVRTPAVIPDFDLFVRNGPQQMTYVAEAILGLVYYANGDTEQALALFDKALANAPAGGGDIVGQEIVYFQRSAALYQQKRLPEAQADLEHALALKPDLFEAHFNLALVYAGTCNPAWQIDRAISEASTAARLRPDSAEAHRLLGDLYRQAGRYDEAITELQAALRAQPDDAPTYATLGDAYAAAGNDPGAKAARERALALREQAATGQPSDPVAAHLDLGDAFMNAGQYDRALAEYGAAQKLAPSDPRAYRGLGNAHYWNNQPDLAIEEYRHWVALAPKDGTAHLLLGMLLGEQKQTQEAIAEVKLSVGLSTCNASERMILGGLYVNQADYSAAATEYAAVTAVDPRNADAQYLLGAVLTQQYANGQPPDPALLPQAAQALTQAVALMPEYPAAYNALANVYFEQKMYGEAAHAWEQTIRYGGADAGYYVALADAYEKLERLDDAAATYQKALALEDDANTRVYLATLYMQQGKNEQALAEYERAAALDPQKQMAHAGAGDAYLRLGKLDEAVAAYQRALALGDDAWLHAGLAGILARQGKAGEAIAEYARAAVLDPGNWRAHLAMGNLYVQLRNPAEAEAAYSAAVEANNDSPEAHAGLAGVAYKRCNLSLAAQEASTAASLAPGAALYRAVLASMYEAQGRHEDAAQVFASLRSAPASDAFAHLLAGDYLLQTRKQGTSALDEAAHEYQLALEVPGLPPFIASLAHAALGQVYYVQDKLMAARGEFELALAASLENAPAQAQLGDIAAREGDRAGALAAYEKAEALLPAYAQSLSSDNAALLAVGLEVRRKLALAHEGQAAGAAAASDRALALANDLATQMPGWAPGRLALGAVYLANGERQKAVAEFAAAAQCDASLSDAMARAEEDLAKLR